MTGQRQKIYIAVIVTCFLASGGVLYFGFRGSKPSQPIPLPKTTVVNNTNQQSSQGALVNSDGTKIYTAPAVFPATDKFDWSVLQNPNFKALKPTEGGLLTNPGPIGRDNPFNNY
jgi:hypothetical protein